VAGKPSQKFESVARVFPILGWLPSYESEWLRADVIAGLTLWGILVPEAIAYAAMAGAPPEADASEPDRGVRDSHVLDVGISLGLR